MSKDKVYLTVIVLLAIALIASCAQQVQQTKRLSISEIVISNEGLKFITEDGKLIATMRATEYGGELTIRNNQGNLIAGVGGTEYGGMIGISTNQEKLVVSIGALEYGGGVTIFNNQEKSVAGMAAFEYGGGLGLYDNQQNRIWPKP